MNRFSSTRVCVGLVLSLVVVSASSLAHARELAGWFSFPNLYSEQDGSDSYREVECTPVAGADVPPGVFAPETPLATGGAIVGIYSQAGVTFRSSLKFLSSSGGTSSKVRGARGKLFATLLHDEPLPLLRVQQLQLTVDGTYDTSGAHPSSRLSVLAPVDFAEVHLEFDGSRYSSIRRADGLHFVMTCSP